MTNEERDIITQFITRVSGAQQQAQVPFGGSVPATTTAPPLPPVDREADALIGNLFQRYPEAPYRISQLAFVQDHALAEAQNRIKRLEWEVQQAQQVAQQAQAQAQAAPQQGSGGFFGGLFGGGQRAAPPQGGPGPAGPGPAWNQGGPPSGYQQAPPPPQYPQGYQQGVLQRSGSGFLGSALTTAAGVAGGLVAGNALMGLFSGSHSGGGLFGGSTPAATPWGGGTPLAAPDQGGYVDQGTWDSGPGIAQADPGYVDNGTWDTPGSTDASWTDNSGGGGGGGGTDDDSLI